VTGRAMPSRPWTLPAAPARDEVGEFVAALRRLGAEDRDERGMLDAVRELALRLAVSQDLWLEERMCRPDPEQGFGIHVLHEEPEHALAVFVVSWLPQRGTAPHDHGTWAVIVGLDGEERNELWRRVDDGTRPGYAEIEKRGERVLGPYAALALPAGAIHSVRNETDRLSVSLHVYGTHVNFTRRSQYDPDARTETPYKVRTYA